MKDGVTPEMLRDEGSRERILTGLEQDGWVVMPHFLPTGVCEEIAQFIHAKRTAGAFHQAGIGQGDRLRVDATVRSDTVWWLDPAAVEQTDLERGVLARIDGIRRILNQGLYLGLQDFEGHLTVYPAGGHYARHVDRFRAHAARTVSLVLYLNPDWSIMDGGLLRLFDPKAESAVLAEILPEAGTLVLFMSADMPHEVTPCRRERMSLTGWYRTAQAGPLR